MFLLGLLLFLANLLNYLDRQLFSALFPSLASRFSLTDPQVGLLGSAFTLAYLLATPMMGLLSDRWNPRRLLGAGVLVFSGGTALCAFSGNVEGLFVGRMLTGVGEAVLLVVGPQVVGDAAKNGLRLAFFLSAMPIGSALGFFLASRSAGIAPGKILFVPVIPGLLLGGLILLLSREKVPGEPPSPSRTAARPPLLPVFRNREVRSLVGVQISNFFVLGGMGVWISLYLTREKHLPVASASLVSGMALLAGGVLGMMAAGWICDRTARGNRRGIYLLLQAGQILSLIGTLAVLGADSTLALFSGVFLASMGLFGVSVPVIVAILRMIPRRILGTALGVSFLLAHLLGDLPAPSLIGLVSLHTGLSLALRILLPAMELAGILVLWILLRRPDAGIPLDFKA